MATSQHDGGGDQRGSEAGSSSSAGLGDGGWRLSQRGVGATAWDGEGSSEGVAVGG